MKKIIAIVFCVLCMIIFVGCDDAAQAITVPDGMQIVRQSKEDGYVFFAPEAWTVANQGDISAVYLSAINPTSITFVKADPPTGTVAEYFESTMESFPYKDSITLSESSGERTNVGNADKAYKYVYSYKYGTYDIACMQVLVQHGGKFFIFTYTSYGDITDENSYYRMYLDRAQAAIDNFLFTDELPDPEAKPAPEHQTDADGYILVSDKSLAGFDLYVPDSYRVIDSSAIVTVGITASSTITVTKANETGVSILSYLSARHDKMSAITSDFTDIQVTVTQNYNSESQLFDDWNISVMPTVDPSLRFADLAQSTTAAYEYSFTYCGTRYHVYQVLGVDGYSGYVFTYTATEEEYEAYLDEVLGILENKVKFN